MCTCHHILQIMVILHKHNRHHNHIYNYNMYKYLYKGKNTPHTIILVKHGILNKNDKLKER